MFGGKWIMWPRKMFVFIISTIGQNSRRDLLVTFTPEKLRGQRTQGELKNPFSVRDSAKSVGSRVKSN